jgi:hypothetical protein
VGVGMGGGASFGNDNWDVGFSNDNYLDVGYDNKMKSGYVTGQYGAGARGLGGAMHGWGVSGTYYFKGSEYEAGGGVGLYGFGVNGGYSSFGEGSWSTGGNAYGVGGSYDFGAKDWSYSYTYQLKPDEKTVPDGIRAEMEDAWIRSNPNDPATRHEEGGWITQNWWNGEYEFECCQCFGRC